MTDDSEPSSDAATTDDAPSSESETTAGSQPSADGEDADLTVEFGFSTETGRFLLAGTPPPAP